MNLLKNNAYHVLGLDTSSNQKEIVKRSKEILTRLKIDDVPGYGVDVKFIDNFRTENSVKEATANLSNPKRRLREYFFWIQVLDAVDEKAVALFQEGKYKEAAKVWRDNSEKDTVKSLLYKKNLVVLMMLLLHKSNDDRLLNTSVALWGELVDSNRFWSAFSKVYRLHDELGVDDEVLEVFRKTVANDISDLYADLSSHHDDEKFVTVFTKSFGLKEGKMESDQLDPIYKTVNDAIEELDSLGVSDDGILDQQETADIKRLVSVIQSEFNKLISLGLYEESKIKSVRDRAASTIRALSIEVNNNLNETSIALGLIKIADSISGTSSFKNKVQQDVKTLQDNSDYAEREKKQGIIVDPIIADFKSGRTEKAMQTINSYLYNEDTDQDVKVALVELKKIIEKRMLDHGKPVGGAPVLFTIWGFGSMIYGDTLYLTGFFIPVFPLVRYSLIDNGGGYSFLGKLELHPWQKIMRVISVIIILSIILFSE